jgi:hypothetical protein
MCQKNLFLIIYFGSIWYYEYWNIFSLSFSLIISSNFCSGSSLSRIHVDPATGFFVDEFGRIRLFRGINSVIKSDPWYDPKLLNPDRQKQISDLGFNVVRLGAMWTGAEPQEDNFNKTYLKIIEVCLLIYIGQDFKLEMIEENFIG